MTFEPIRAEQLQKAQQDLCIIRGLMKRAAIHRHLMKTGDNRTEFVESMREAGVWINIAEKWLAKEEEEYL